jgi:hypothetical protein
MVTAKLITVISRLCFSIVLVGYYLLQEYNFALVLYGFETWSFTLRKQRRLRVFENMVLRRIFGPKSDEVTYIHTYIQTYIHTYAHTYIRTYIHTYVRMYIHKYVCTEYYNLYWAAGFGKFHPPGLPCGRLQRQVCTVR